jgi:hypothetical protein
MIGFGNDLISFFRGYNKNDLLRINEPPDVSDL